VVRMHLAGQNIELTTYYLDLGMTASLLVFSGTSVPDPDVFGPPGSGSVIYLYGSRSGPFHQQAKN
jgi:hypothetical protein